LSSSLKIERSKSEQYLSKIYSKMLQLNDNENKSVDIDTIRNRKNRDQFDNLCEDSHIDVD